METDTLSSSSFYGIKSDWFQEAFITESLLTHLKANGFKIADQAESNSKTGGSKIVATRYFKKEIIEVKGFPLFAATGNEPIANITRQAHPAKRWFSEMLFHSLIHLNPLSGDHHTTEALALPNIDRYKSIIYKVQDYFAYNDLSFKIYLINEDGTVEVSNLNYKYA